MTEWNCMDPEYPDRLCNYKDCEVECPYREAHKKLEAMREWANLNYIKPGRSKQVQRLFDILEAEERDDELDDREVLEEDLKGQEAED